MKAHNNPTEKKVPRFYYSIRYKKIVQRKIKIYSLYQHTLSIMQNSFKIEAK